MKNILENFFRHYFELPKKPAKVVCIGGGTGLSNLLTGLRQFNLDLTAIVTMCDEGGSTGRLRRQYDIPAVGDLRKCLAALSATDPTLVNLLNFRFTGERYTSKDQLGGHSFGNLFLLALSDITGNFNKGLEEASRLLNISGRVLPSTLANARIWAEMSDGQRVYGEQNIDLGTYQGKSEIKRLNLDPANAKGYPKAIEEISQAKLIIVGPGDLYTSILPNLLISDITKAIKATSAKKVFVANIANKPSETKDYALEKYFKVIENHIGFDPFDCVIVNTNYSKKLPKSQGYTIVKIKDRSKVTGKEIIEGDLVHAKFPTHHDGTKTAQVILSLTS